MKKFSQTYLKNFATSPIKSPSPDFRAANKIVATKSPKNNPNASGYLNRQPYQYRQIRDSRQNRTPTKTWVAPKNQQSTTHKYFSNNRSVQNMNQDPHSLYDRKSFNHTIRTQGTKHHPTTHSHCRQNNQEIAAQLRKLMSMISGNTSNASHTNISQFRTYHHHDQQQYSPQKQKIHNQMMRIDSQNKRLLKLIQQLQSKVSIQAPCAHVIRATQLQHQLDILRVQLSKTISECDKQYQILLQGNQTLNSQLYSIKDRNSILEKQADSLRYLLKERDQDVSKKQQETRRKNNNDKLSLSMIREQYSESVKALGDNLAAQINYKNEDNQRKVKQLSHKLTIQQERTKVLEKKLKDSLINSSRRDLLSSSAKKQSSPPQNNNNQLISQIQYLTNQLQKHKKQLHDKQVELQQQKKNYQIQLSRLSNKLKQSSYQNDRDTQSKIKKLMENYQQQIAILKKQNKSIIYNKNNLGNQLENINNIRYQMQQEIQRRDQQINRLQSQIYSIKLQDNHKQDYNQLKAQNTSLYLQLTKFQQQNKSLQSQIDNLSHLQHKIQQLNRQNSQLNDEHANKISSINQAYIKLQSNILLQEQQNQQLLNQKDQKIRQLELTIHNLSKVIQDNQNKLQIIQNQYNGRSGRLEDSYRQLSQLYDNEKNKSVNIQGRLREQLRQQLQQQIQKQLTYKFITENQQSSKQIKQQLINIKRLVNDGKFDKLEGQLIRIVQLYNRQLINSQRNTQEIQKLTRIKFREEERLAELENLNIALEEKCKILEGNSRILRDELRERKEICQKVLLDKSVVQKQILMLKQQRLDKSSIQSTKAKAKQISSKIDKLLTLQSQRQKSIIHKTTSYMVSTTKTQ